MYRKYNFTLQVTEPKEAMEDPLVPSPLADSISSYTVLDKMRSFYLKYYLL
jgi:hypothetical protein